ncbi:putative toxin-antitoxin system toxin component, PIN family [Phocaeicola oris]|uniref:putative toxin-antitoxin system toxin component, PIN family n=1 Tax=Phocaeicola oris TaxID=2896850 RepID=UPI00234F9A4E|nr:putative toxin-antitoxin system toxin component, PIN family [Phocaeicola oris]MCE2616859.1 putative toxin-antitoxin system toxin component, PIN family [Phocaeicola oris]
MKIVIDTNLWISFLIKGNVTLSLKEIIGNGKTAIVMSQELEEEIMAVVRRPKFQKYFSETSCRLLLSFLRKRCEYHSPIEPTQHCRDPKDDFLLGLSLVSDADFLLTGDDDLLAMETVGNCRILTLSAFLTQ